MLPVCVWVDGCASMRGGAGTRRGLLSWLVGAELALFTVNGGGAAAAGGWEAEAALADSVDN